MGVGGVWGLRERKEREEEEEGKGGRRPVSRAVETSEKKASRRRGFTRAAISMVGI